MLLQQRQAQQLEHGLVFEFMRARVLRVSSGIKSRGIVVRPHLLRMRMEEGWLDPPIVDEAWEQRKDTFMALYVHRR
jgi:hypothetical protein